MTAFVLSLEQRGNDNVRRRRSANRRVICSSVIGADKNVLSAEYSRVWSPGAREGQACENNLCNEVNDVEVVGRAIG